jgi:hypothetical protein
MTERESLLESDLEAEKAHSRALEAEVEDKENMLMELSFDLRDKQEMIDQLIARQLRDQRNTEVIFAVRHDGGEIDHAGKSFEAAKIAADFYDDGEVVSRRETVTDWVTVHTNQEVEDEQ